MAAEIDPFPSPESFKGIGTSLEAAGGNGKNLDHLKQAVEEYRKAYQMGQKAMITFYMGVALERLGRTEEAEPILESIQRSEAPTSCLNDSWGYVR
jgi:tetratricopeptide (TPR) repeat protein